MSTAKLQTKASRRTLRDARRSIIVAAVAGAYMDKLAANIRRLRERAGLTQVELAHKAGLARDSIQKLEHGKWKDVGIGVLVDIAAALGCSLEELAEISTDRASVFVDKFLAGPGAMAASVTPAEIEWLRSLPEIIWRGNAPTDTTILHLILAHRSLGVASK